MVGVRDATSSNVYPKPPYAEPKGRNSMGLLIFVLVLVLLAAAGILGFIVKVAVGVALGIFLAVFLVTAIVGWRFRRFLRGPRSPRRRQGSSRVEIIEPGDRW
jgi:membrane protein implicated in regulation of membrane protease activity